MNINFEAYQPDKQNIYLFDSSPVYNSVIPEQINSMTLDIVSNVLSGGRIDQIDLIAYLFSSDREDNLLYHITSSTLGLGESQDIPDGIYELTYTINNMYTKTHKFLVYLQVKEDTLELLQNTGYTVKVGSYDISYVGDTSEGDIEKTRLASTLLDELISYTVIIDEAKVNSTLDKLRRLLTLIESEIE